MVRGKPGSETELRLLSLTVPARLSRTEASLTGPGLHRPGMLRGRRLMQAQHVMHSPVSMRAQSTSGSIAPTGAPRRAGAAPGAPRSPTAMKSTLPGAGVSPVRTAARDGDLRELARPTRRPAASPGWPARAPRRAPGRPCPGRPAAVGVSAQEKECSPMYAAPAIGRQPASCPREIPQFDERIVVHAVPVDDDADGRRLCGPRSRPASRPGPPAPGPCTPARR